VPSSKVIERAIANFFAILSRLRMSVASLVFHEETKERHPRAKRNSISVTPSANKVSESMPDVFHLTIRRNKSSFVEK